VGATLASAFLSLYFDLPDKMSAEFRTLGPNLMAAPRGPDHTFPESIRERLAARTVADTENKDTLLLPWLYAVGYAEGKDVILGGTELPALAQMHPSWRGLPAEPSGEIVIAGEQAAEQFGWSPGDQVRVRYGEQEISLKLAGVVSTGGSEDSQLLMSLATLQALTDQAGRLSLIQIAAPGKAAQVESVWQGFAASVADVPAVEIRALRPVVESEVRVVMKVRGLMLGLAAIVLALVILGVLTNVSGRILDRQKDIGVMKALGGSDAGIARMFLAETAAHALLASALGLAAGFALARAAAARIFQSSIALRWDVAAAVVVITLGVALVATALPSRWIRRMDPAVILRGE
jgi:putative ABC transport system permease protein